MGGNKAKIIDSFTYHVSSYFSMTTGIYYERVNSCVIMRSEKTWRFLFPDEMATLPLVTRHDHRLRRNTASEAPDGSGFAFL
jgi:hypothetical protein